jgi:hypothetical protein
MQKLELDQLKHLQDNAATLQLLDLLERLDYEQGESTSAQPEDNERGSVAPASTVV